METRADSLLIAVSSNFTLTAQEIAAEFETATGHDVRISSASTGKLYVQIVNGAPFDLFLAADIARPERLEAAGLGVAGTRFGYAYGRLVLWSRNQHPDDLNCLEQLQTGRFRWLAIANPDTAPYGAAAKQLLKRSGLWNRLQANLVIGENISQTLQFVSSGSADLGLVALSQLNNAHLPKTSCEWLVPSDMHDPIEQQAILLNRAADKSAARAFLHFLRGEEGRAIVSRSGYHLSAGGSQ